MVKKGRDFIKSDPAVMMGKPVITGTRVTVELILEKLAAGETVKQIIDEHPRLTKEGVYAALRFIKKMPKDKNIKRVLVIGSGPIIIGQACEFDYSGTQACKALKEEGYEVMLVNFNPATIMINPGNTEELAVKGTFYGLPINRIIH